MTKLDDALTQVGTTLDQCFSSSSQGRAAIAELRGAVLDFKLAQSQLPENIGAAAISMRDFIANQLPIWAPNLSIATINRIRSLQLATDANGNYIQDAKTRTYSIR